jgi:hypothetical protein
MNSKLLLISISADSVRARFRLSCTSVGERLIVRAPHPRESIWPKNDGKDLRRKYFPLEWVAPNPIEMDEGETVVFSVELCPYWTSFKGRVSVECDVQWKRLTDHEWNVAKFADGVDLSLPTMEELRAKQRELTAQLLESGDPLPDNRRERQQVVVERA